MQYLCAPYVPGVFMGTLPIDFIQLPRTLCAMQKGSLNIWGFLCFMYKYSSVTILATVSHVKYTKLSITLTIDNTCARRKGSVSVKLVLMQIDILLNKINNKI